MAHYSDQALAKLFKAAKETSTTKVRASYYENALIGKWVKDEKTPACITSMLGRKVTPDDTFKLLKIDMGTENIFATREYNVWAAYAHLFKRENPNVASKPVIETLMASYSDQVLLRMINTAKQTPTTKIRAAFFEKALFAKWVENGETSAYISKMLGRHVTPGDAFKFLALDKAGGNLFTHSGYDTWLTYAKAFKNENPNAKKDPVIDTLTTSLGDHALVELIKRTEKTPATKENAAYIKNALLDEWVKTNKSPAYVMNKLGTPEGDKKALLNSYLEKIKSSAD